MASYVQKSVEWDPQTATLTTNKGVQVYTVTKTDKILWTNKLKSIALALPKKVWISDLEIQGSAEKLEGIRLDKRALTLICHVSSDTQDHLMAIAQFIKNLKSQKGFIKDFTDVKFHSAARNPEDQDTLDFALTFPLKRNLLEDNPSFYLHRIFDHSIALSEDKHTIAAYHLRVQYPEQEPPALSVSDSDSPVSTHNSIAALLGNQNVPSAHRHIDTSDFFAQLANHPESPRYEQEEHN